MDYEAAERAFKMALLADRARSDAFETRPERWFGDASKAIVDAALKEK